MDLNVKAKIIKHFSKKHRKNLVWIKVQKDYVKTH